jgi:hypothetical protein
MDPAQLAHEACKRFEAMHAAAHEAGHAAHEAGHSPGATRTFTEPPGPRLSHETRDSGEDLVDLSGDQGDQPLLEVLDHLGKLDGWAKIAMDRLAGDPADDRAAEELCRSLEQTARLHPYFTRRLADVLAPRT